MNNLARPWEVIVSCFGMKTHCLDNQSTIMRMAVKPSEGGSCSIKSMDVLELEEVRVTQKVCDKELLNACT